MARTNDLLEAWGPDAKFIWTYRPLEESIESLIRRGWWPGREQAIQSRLWQSVNTFFDKQPHLRLDFAEVISDPKSAVQRISTFLRLSPTDRQCREAIASIRPGS